MLCQRPGPTHWMYRADARGSARSRSPGHAKASTPSGCSRSPWAQSAAASHAPLLPPLVALVNQPYRRLCPSILLHSSLPTAAHRCPLPITHTHSSPCHLPRDSISPSVISLPLPHAICPTFVTVSVCQASIRRSLCVAIHLGFFFCFGPPAHSS